MAGQTTGNQPFNPYLSNAQQELLLAALASNNPPSNHVKSKPSTDMNPLDFDDTSPYLEYLDGDTSFDFDNADLGGEMIGALPGSGLEPEQHDKRKSPDENESPEEGDAKRQETQEGEKGAKKPGRKPLTNEPTTVSLRCFVRFANTRTPPSTQLAPVIPQSPLQTMRALSICVLDASISQ